jgi:hypothetical protein
MNDATNILRGLIATKYAEEQFVYLDRGIGTRTPEGALWLAARDEVRKALNTPPSPAYVCQGCGGAGLVDSASEFSGFAAWELATKVRGLTVRRDGDDLCYAASAAGETVGRFEYPGLPEDDDSGHAFGILFRTAAGYVANLADGQFTTEPHHQDSPRG